MRRMPALSTLRDGGSVEALVLSRWREAPLGRRDLLGPLPGALRDRWKESPAMQADPPHGPSACKATTSNGMGAPHPAGYQGASPNAELKRTPASNDTGRARLFPPTQGHSFSLSGSHVGRSARAGGSPKTEPELTGEASCQPDVLAPPKFGAWDRHTGSERRSQLRVVRFAPQKSVAVRRQACPKTVILWKMSEQLLQFGKGDTDRDPTILRWDALDAVQNERILAVLPK